MVWRSLLVAALLTLPAAYVVGMLVTSAEPVERRPALVLEREGAEPPGIEPRVTLGPTPGGPTATDDPEDDDPEDGPDEVDEPEDDDPDDVEVVRPGAQDLDDDEEDDDLD